MEKKYYDIIVSLVKQNDKYAGCEPILDDIVQDVYAHSKVVLGSVSNEDVIAAYLNKVVATSLITVPKKLNFNTRNKHRIISNVEAITNVSLPQKQNIEPSETVELNLSEPVASNELTFEQELLEETTTELTEKDLEAFDIDDAEETLEIKEEIEEKEEETITFETESVVEDAVALDFEPVVEEAEEEPFLLEEAEEIASIESEEIEVGQEPAKEEDNEAFLLEEAEEIISAESEEIKTEDEHEALFLQEETFELSDEIEEVITPEQDVDKTLVDKMINGVDIEPKPVAKEFALDTDNEALELIEEAPLEQETTIEFEEPEITAEIEAPVFELNSEELATLESESIEEFETMELEEKAPVLETVFENTSFELPNFDCFSYEPKKPDFNEEEICSDLKEFDTKHPEKKLLQICKLKFEEKLSVSEIAEKIEFSEEDVLDTLNDIIELVKD